MKTEGRLLLSESKLDNPLCTKRSCIMNSEVNLFYRDTARERRNGNTGQKLSSPTSWPQRPSQTSSSHLWYVPRTGTNELIADQGVYVGLGTERTR